VLLSLPEREDDAVAESDIPQSSDDRKSIIQDVVDLPPALFDEYPSKENQLRTVDSDSNLDRAAPPVLDYEEDWNDVFQQVKHSRFPEPTEDPVLLKWTDQARATSTQSEPLISGSHLGSQSKKHGSHPQSAEHGSSLQDASYGGKQNIVKLLLQEGVDVNAQGGQYGSALYAASAAGHEDIVQLLLNNGADANIRGGKYGTTLQAASSAGHKDIFQLLLDNGADINDNALLRLRLMATATLSDIFLHRVLTRTLSIGMVKHHSRMLQSMDIQMW